MTSWINLLCAVLGVGRITIDESLLVFVTDLYSAHGIYTLTATFLKLLQSGRSDVLSSSIAFILMNCLMVISSEDLPEERPAET